MFTVSVFPLKGFNATLTEPKGTRGRRRGQIRKMELKLHPDLKDLLKRLCNESKTTVVALNGGVLDHVSSLLSAMLYS